MPYALCPMPYALCPVVPHMRDRKAISTINYQLSTVNSSFYFSTKNDPKSARDRSLGQLLNRCDFFGMS